jgi:hypothetical protein
VCACLPVFQFGINREDLSTGPLEFYLSVGVATLVGLCCVMAILGYSLLL